MSEWKYRRVRLAVISLAVTLGLGGALSQALSGYSDLSGIPLSLAAAMIGLAWAVYARLRSILGSSPTPR